MVLRWIHRVIISWWLSWIIIHGRINYEWRIICFIIHTPIFVIIWHLIF